MITFWRRSSFGTICAALVGGMMAACGDGGPYQAPVGPTPTLSQLAGSWAGLIDPQSDRIDRCWGLEWAAIQDGTNATGRLRIGGISRDESFNPVMGTMTATPSGNGFTLALTLPSGAVSNPACSMTGGGTVAAGRSFEGPETVMVGPVTLEWTAACNGVLYNNAGIHTHPGTLLLKKDGPVPRAC